MVSGTGAIVGTSGKPTRVFAVNFLSDGTAGVLILRNGTTSGGTAYVQENGVISKGVTVSYGPVGILFPAGCFLDIDSHCVGGVVSYAKDAP